MLKPSFSALVKNSPILPVLHMESVEDAINVSRALYKGGITCAEIVLRSPVALDCIKAVNEQVPEMTVGVGTLTTPQQVIDSVAAGAKFLISPSFTPTLASAMLETGLPMLPGVVSPSEITRALELGITELKFFPAEQYGGIQTIKALSSVFSQISFCPTGGVNLSNMADYFALNSVFAVGGSWMVPKALIAKKDWDTITLLSRQAIETINNLDKYA